MPNRHQHRRLAFALAAVALAVAACGSATVSPAATPDVPVASPSDEPSMAPASMAPGPESMAPGSMAPATADPTEAPTPDPAAEALGERAWATAELVDVTSGESFRIADFAGRTVFVEAMAIWCTKCRAQQTRFTEALAGLDPEQVAYVVLTVDPGETAEDLARYQDRQGFTGSYAVAGDDVSRALVADFGPNVINPPTVPVIHVTPDGEISFMTGGESVDDIVKLAGG